MLIEKDFTIVLYNSDKFNHVTKKPEYFLNLYEEKSSCKCPPGIFDENVLTIPNDGKFVYHKIVEFAS